MTTQVPFTDIYVDDAIVDRVEEVLRSTRYVKGPEGETFESKFADACNVDHAIGVSSGTAAILLSLQAAGVEAGDDVFVPGHTFFASASPILSIDANPVFIDVDPKYYTMDPSDLRAKAENADSPAAVVPVHIYGQIAAMKDINRIADEYDLAVVEDSCQAHFASRDSEYAGTFGDAGAFSFYPSKNMTVGGDGGMIVTDDADLAAEARALRNHGRNDVGEHVRLGLNYRLDEVSAAVGAEQLKHIHDWNEGRRRAARRYDDRLADVPEVETPSIAPENDHVYHLYVVRADNRDALREHLDSVGVQTGIHYPTPAHEHEAVVEHVGETSLPVTEKLVDEIVSLPMHPRITDEEIEIVVEEIEGFYA